MVKRGFTLIELVVVVGIIGLLSALAVISLSRQQARSRDTKRVADLTNINTALQSYIAENYKLPLVSDYTLNYDHGGWDYSSEYGRNFVTGGDTTFMRFLVDGNYMATVPRDPINDGTGDVHYPHLGGTGYAYAYFYYGDSVHKGYDLNGMTTYILATRLETGVSAGSSSGTAFTYPDYPNVTIYSLRQTAASR